LAGPLSLWLLQRPAARLFWARTQGTAARGFIGLLSLFAFTGVAWAGRKKKRKKKKWLARVVVTDLAWPGRPCLASTHQSGPRSRRARGVTVLVSGRADAGGRQNVGGGQLGAGRSARRCRSTDLAAAYSRMRDFWLVDRRACRKPAFAGRQRGCGPGLTNSYRVRPVETYSAQSLLSIDWCRGFAPAGGAIAGHSADREPDRLCSPFATWGAAHYPAAGSTRGKAKWAFLRQPGNAGGTRHVAGPREAGHGPARPRYGEILKGQIAGFSTQRSLLYRLDATRPGGALIFVSKLP